MEHRQQIEISESAAKRIAFLLGKEKTGVRLRVAVDGGGCSGFQYKFDFDAEKHPDDALFARDGAEVLVDALSLGYMEGSVLDYVETLGDARFEVKNPKATAKCGCGNSFAV